MKRVLILGGRAPVSLYLAKILSENSHRVFTADSIRRFVAKKAKYIEKGFVIRKPNEDIEGFTEDINKIVKDNNIDIVIPTCEEAFHLSKVKEKINTVVFVEDFSKMIKLHDKYEFIKFCESIDIRIPETKIVTKDDKFKTSKKSIVKPRFSRFGSEVFIREKNTFVVLNGNYDYVLQEFLEGNQICSYSIAVEGNVLLHVNYHTKYVVNTGTNIFFEYIQKQEVLKIVEVIVKELNFTGQIAFDFIETNKGIMPIECNPRATSGLCLLPNNIDILECMFNKNKPEIKKYNTEAIKTLMFFRGIFNLKFLEKAYRQDFRSANDNVLASGIKCNINQIASLATFFLIAKKNKIRIESASTLDIECNSY